MARCQADCGWRGPAADAVWPIPDLGERVSAGEIVPPGECPNCRSLAEAVEPVGAGKDGEPRLRMACETCGSDDVMRDAWASWSYDAQDWELRGEPFDDAFCESCECETSIVEVKDGEKPALVKPIFCDDHPGRGAV